MKIKFSLIILACILFSLLPVRLIAAPVPDTDQEDCFDDTSNTVIFCPRPGQDFYGQDPNYTINPQSFTKLDADGNDLPSSAVDWVMVRDNVTGLIWEVKQGQDGSDNYNDPHDADNLYTWYDGNPATNGGHSGTPGEGTDTQDFITALNSAKFGGFSDWRLPSVKEISFITSRSWSSDRYYPNRNYFPNTMIPGRYLTSNTYAYTEEGTSVWTLDVDSLVRVNLGVVAKEELHHVRAVRGASHENDFIDNGDGTVTDIATGLMWQQAGLSDGDWQYALYYAEELDHYTSHAGYTDWRLPNSFELQSIVDYHRYNPAIDESYFPNTYSYTYWSSTNDGLSAEQIGFASGDLHSTSKTTSSYIFVRPVRGGQIQHDGHLLIFEPVQSRGWTPGDTKVITWNPQDIPGSVRISLSRDGGKDGTYTDIIAESTENDGAFTWTVTGPSSFNCMLMIEPLESGYTDMGAVQGLFTISDPAFSSTPASHSFDNAVAGYSCAAPILFTIKNTGHGELHLSDISIAGTDQTDYSIIDDECTGRSLQKNEACAIEVEFCPEAGIYGQKTASLSMATNDPAHPAIALALYGVALEPGTLLVTPSETFTASGYPGGPFSPSDKAYLIENTGEDPLEWTVSKSAAWIDLSQTSGTLNPTESASVQVLINTWAENFMLGTYEDAVVFVNTTNGQGNTARSVALNVIKPPSTISCNPSTDHLVLGSPLTISGQILPAPSDAGAFVSLVLQPSFGQTIYRSVNANALGEFNLTVACGDIYRDGEWTIQTNWSGDSFLQGASSPPQVFTVTKAESSVTLDVSSQAVKFGDPVSLSGKLTPHPDCGRDLTSVAQITFFITGPEGADIQFAQTNDPWGHFLLENYSGFDMLGDWTIQASFSGNEAYLPSSSPPVQVRVVETAGYAVVIQGRISQEEGIESHDKTAQFVYDKLVDRGLLADDIMYFNYDFGNPARAEIDALPTKDGIQSAIVDWAVSKMNAKPANLYIVAVDHGLEDSFYIHPETITAADIDAWLTAAQNALTGQASMQEIIVLLGFCRSGSFVDDLSGSNRVIIASAAEDESSYKGPLDEDGIREGEYFLSEFFKSVSFGRTVKESFEGAVVSTEAYTSTGTGDAANAPFYDDSFQHPLLDDNGDGKGSNDLSDPNGDGTASHDLFIGVTPVTGNDPGDVVVVEKTGTLFMGTEDSNVDLFARVSDNTRLMAIWTEVKPPGYSPIDLGGSGQLEMDLVKTYGVWNSSTYRYEWPALGAGFNDPEFSVPGKYQVFYFAKDNVTQHVSPLMESWVYKAKDPNQPPQAFDLLSPEPGAEVLTTCILDWGDATDPDGDALTYTVTLSKNIDFHDAIVIPGIPHSAVIIGPHEGVEDLTSYFWKVEAIDEYGSITTSETRSFSTNNTNPVAGWIKGVVYNTATGTPITNAFLSIGTVDLNSSLNGYFLGLLSPGFYTVHISAPGYLPSHDTITIPEGVILTRNFGLGPDTQPTVSIESPSGDATIETGESLDFQGSIVNGEAPFIFAWDFDGGAPDSILEDPGNVVFFSEGVYYITFTATDADGDTGSDSVIVSVHSVDHCPDDPLKTEPGICGCGTPDTDTDGDAEADCVDFDDDGDGMPDDWEEFYGLLPLVDDADEDLDHDGLTNLEEYLGDSDPTDPRAPRPRLMPWLPILLE